MLWNLNMIPGNVLMNAGGFLMVPDDCWWLCQIAAGFGPRLNVRRLGMVVPIPAASFADYCSDMDLSRTKPTELHLCRLWRARFFSVLPQRERIGSRWWPAMGGVLLVEADKMLYAPSGKTSRLQRRETVATPVLVGQSCGALSPKI